MMGIPERPELGDDIPDDVRAYVEALETECARLRNIDQTVGVTLGENARLKQQVNILIHAIGRMVLAEFVHVDAQEGNG